MIYARFAMTWHDVSLLIDSQECTQIRPADWEVSFNWGNTLYRWARVKEKEKNDPEALKLLRAAAEKCACCLLLLRLL